MLHTISQGIPNKKSPVGLKEGHRKKGHRKQTFDLFYIVTPLFKNSQKEKIELNMKQPLLLIHCNLSALMLKKRIKDLFITEGMEEEERVEGTETEF